MVSVTCKYAQLAQLATLTFCPSKIDPRSGWPAGWCLFSGGAQWVEMEFTWTFLREQKETAEVKFGVSFIRFC